MLRGFVCWINKWAEAVETFSFLVQILRLREAIREIKVLPINQFLKKKFKKKSEVFFFLVLAKQTADNFTEGVDGAM